MTEFRKAIIEHNVAVREPLRGHQPGDRLLPPPKCFDPQAHHHINDNEATESAESLVYGCIPSTIQELYSLLGPRFHTATEELFNLTGLDLSDLPLSGEIHYIPAFPPSRSTLSRTPDSVQTAILIFPHSAGEFDVRSAFKLPGGSAEASKRLAFFLGRDPAGPLCRPPIANYKIGRALAGGEVNSTKLSPFLSLGCFSARQVNTDIQSLGEHEVYDS